MRIRTRNISYLCFLKSDINKIFLKTYPTYERASSKKIKGWGMKLFYSLLSNIFLLLYKQTLWKYQSLVKSRFETFKKNELLSFKLYFFLGPYCFTKFDDSFSSVVCWIVILEMQKQSFEDALENRCF